jgi:hypothetical protein
MSHALPEIETNEKAGSENCSNSGREKSVRTTDPGCQNSKAEGSRSRPA